MPQSWQIKQARGFQTQGVWSLDPDFTIGDATIESHTDSLADILGAATTSEGYKNLLDTADGTLRAEYAFFKSMNIAVAARLDSEVPDNDPLQIDIDQLRIDAVSRAAVEERTLKTAAAWIKINAARAAEDPAKPPVAVRGSLAAAFQTRWLALPVKRQAREQAAGVWRTGSSQLRAADKALDRINKDWYQAWKSEYPPGTAQGDALAGIDTEDGTNMPEVLEIAGIVQEGLSLRVTYVPGTGDHATVKDLNYLVEGVHGDFQRITADTAAGNLIGPFTEGQIVRIRTDVGNSRDNSELSPEQAVTIQPVP